MDTTILPDAGSVVVRTADIIEEFFNAHDTSTFGLSGGSGPPPIHRELARRDIRWDTVTTWMSDERWVDPSHDDSNQRAARTALVDATGVRFLAPDTTMSEPQEAARGFETLLIEHDIGGSTPSVLMLGMGDDGHTASLFPSTTALAVDDRSYVANWVAKLDAWRLTATYPLIHNTDLVLFVVMGSAKADMVAQVAAGKDVPAARVTARGHVRWILDEAAARSL
jgi:6-phosphogluconolactonase